MNAKRIVDWQLTSTDDRERATKSRWRWFDDGSGTYRLRIRGLIPIWLVRRVKWLYTP